MNWLKQLLGLLSICFLVGAAYADTKVFTREYTYQASEADSKISSRAIALEQVKRLLLEEVGTYMLSETIVKNFELTKDQTVTLTAGVVQTKVVMENWDGIRYWIKAEIEVDQGEVAKSIDELHKDKDKTLELEELRKRTNNILTDINKLQKELQNAKDDTKKIIEFSNAINRLSATDFYDEAFRYLQMDKYNIALTYYDKAVKLDPNYQDAFNKRGVINNYLGHSEEAISNFDRSISLDPKDAQAYYGRGMSKMNLGRNEEAIMDFDKAIELEPLDFDTFAWRGNAKVQSGKHVEAVEDLDRSIELNPNYLPAYFIRSRAYVGFNVFKYSEALRDLDKAIELSSQFLRGSYYYKGKRYNYPIKYANKMIANVYQDRGQHYAVFNQEYDKAFRDLFKAIELDPQGARSFVILGNIYQSLNDQEYFLSNYRIAARLGHKEAQGYLQSKGITW